MKFTASARKRSGWTDMKTGHQLCFFIRTEYSASAWATDSAWANDLGSLDAPDLIVAGSHERVASQAGAFNHGLPTVACRENM